MTNNEQHSKEELFLELENLKKEYKELKIEYQNSLQLNINRDEELKASEERFHMLFDKAPLGYQSLDFDGYFIEVNQKWLDTLGYSHEEVIGKWFGSFLTPVYQEGFRKRFPIFKANGVIHSEFEMVHKDGSILFIAFEGRIGYKNSGEFKQTHCILQDITEQRRAEIALKDSEERMRLAVENSPVPIMIHDEDDNVILLSKGWIKFSGYTIDDIPTLSDWTEKAYGERTGTKKDYIDNLFNINETVNNGEWIITAKDGSKRIWDFQTTPIGKTNSGKSVLHSMAIDITEQKSVENDLRTAREKAEESEARFKNLFENHNAIMLLIEPESGKIIDANDSAINFYGFPKSILTSMVIDEINNLPAEQVKVERFIALDEKRNYFEFPHKLSNGDIRTVEVHSSPITYNNGTILFSVIHDITERKKAEEKVREKDIQFRKLSANVSDLIFQFTRKVDGSYCVPIASEGIINIFGCKPEDVLEDFTPIANVIYPDDAERVINDIEYSANHLTFFTCEFRVKIPGKNIQWIYSKSTPEKLSDGSVTWYGFNTDITVRKLAEELLSKQNQELEAQYEEYMQLNEVLRQTNYSLEIEKEKAEESDKLKTAFLQNMSHEIRTPLNGILGFSNLLTIDNISKSDIKEYSGIIQRSGKRLLETVNNVLDISKIETGQIVIIKKPFSLNSLISDLYSFFYPFANSKNIILTYHKISENDKNTINSDEFKLNQIFTNLIGNALKFTESGNIDFGYEVKNNSYVFFVKDTGSGITDDMHDRIFDRFTQSNLAVSRGYEGAGLGLAICKGLIELLDGKIWVESKINIGSTFYFTLPIDTVQSSVNEEKEYSKSIIKTIKTKVLIVEDDYTSYIYLLRVLKNSNCELIWAENGSQALEFVKSEPDINLVLMDIKMPIMDGFEATKQIKKIRPKLPIIAQTAYAFSEEKEKILSIGCDDYLSKPIEPDKLLKLIDKYFSDL